MTQPSLPQQTYRESSPAWSRLDQEATRLTVALSRIALAHFHWPSTHTTYTQIRLPRKASVPTLTRWWPVNGGEAGLRYKQSSNERVECDRAHTSRTSCRACPQSGTICGFSPGSLKLKLSGSRQTGHASSSSLSWLDTTGTGAATMAAKG